MTEGTEHGEALVVSLEGHIAPAAPDDESLTMDLSPDEDGELIFAKQGAPPEEAQTWRPVIVRIHPDSDRETVLRLLEKMRAKVEQNWPIFGLGGSKREYPDEWPGGPSLGHRP